LINKVKEEKEKSANIENGLHPKKASPGPMNESAPALSKKIIIGWSVSRKTLWGGGGGVRRESSLFLGGGREAAILIKFGAEVFACKKVLGGR